MELPRRKSSTHSVASPFLPRRLSVQMRHRLYNRVRRRGSTSGVTHAIRSAWIGISAARNRRRTGLITRERWENTFAAAVHVRRQKRPERRKTNDKRTPGPNSARDSRTADFSVRLTARSFYTWAGKSARNTPERRGAEYTLYYCCRRGTRAPPIDNRPRATSVFDVRARVFR